MKGKRGAVCVMLLGVMCFVAACGSSSPNTGGDTGSTASGGSKAPIEIGTSFPTTGPVGAACAPYSDGAVAWFQHVNAGGGINGRKIVDNVQDDAYTAPEALANARQFAQQNVLAIFNGCGTIQPPAIQPVAKANGIPYLFPFGAVPQLTNPVQSNYFAILPLFSQQGAGLIKAAFAKDGPGSVYVFNVEVPGAQQTLQAIERATKQGGGTFVGESTEAPAQPDYTPAVLKMKAAHPDYVVLAETAADSVAIVQAIKQQNAMPGKLFLGTTSETNSGFLTPSASLVDGKFLGASPVVPPNDEGAASCDHAFKDAKPAVPASVGALWGCGIAQALVAGIKGTKANVTRSNLIHVVAGWRNAKVSSVLPALTFTPTNHLGVHTMTLLGIKNGAFVNAGTMEIR